MSVEIPANVFGIIAFSWKVSAFVWESIEQIKDLPVTIRLFDNNLRCLRVALEQVQALRENGMTIEERQHYEVVETIIKGCCKIVRQLESQLPNLTPNPSILKRVIVVLERRLNENEIREKTNAIRSYTETIQVSLHALSLRKLSMLGASIEEILRRVQKIDSHMLPTPPTNEQMNGTADLPHENALEHRTINDAWKRSLNVVTSRASTMPTPETSQPASPNSSPLPISIGLPGLLHSDSSSESSVSGPGSSIAPRRDSSVFTMTRRNTGSQQPRKASAPIGEKVLELTEKDVEKEVEKYVSRGCYSEAAKQQKEYLALRRKLASELSRLFPLKDELDLQSRHAEFLLKCPTVVKRRMALNILRNLLPRIDDLPDEGEVSSQRELIAGRIHYWLAWLLVRPVRHGSLETMKDAQTHSRQAIKKLEFLDPELAVKSGELLVYALRQDEKEIEAKNWETSLSDRFASPEFLDMESPKLPTHRRPSVASTAGSDQVCPGSIDVLEWCQNLHKEGCVKDCNQQHINVYTDQFSFDAILFDNGQSFFDIAIREGNTAIVREMLPEIDLTKKPNALFLAARTAKPRLVQLLLSHGIPLSELDPNTGTSILHHSQDSVTVTKDIITAMSSSLTAEKIAFLANQREPNTHRTPLYRACYDGNARMVTAVLTCDHVDPNIPDHVGKTPLHCAVEIPDDVKKSGGATRIRITRELLARGARPAVSDNRDVTPLHTAAQKGYADVVREILVAFTSTSPSVPSSSSSNNSTRTRSSSSSFSYIHHFGDHDDDSMTGSAKAVDVSRRKQQLLNKRVLGSGETPLIAAVKGHHIEVVRLLVAAGASPEIVDKRRKDAKAHAVEPRREELLRALKGR